ncbi:MAG: hypothetical protein AAGJ18_28800 [Bacteroidota bacterium]
MKWEYELIEQYLDKQLTGTALEDFKKELSSDPSLQEKVKLLSKLRQAVGQSPSLDKQANQLRQTLKPFGEQYFKEETLTDEAPLKVSFVKKPFFRIAIAASFLLISLLGTHFWVKQQYNKEAIVQAQREVLNVGDRNTNTQQLGLASTDSTYLLAQYITAETMFDQKNYEAAQAGYRTILANQSNPIYDKKEINFELVYWNQLLTYLALEDADNLKAAMIYIQNSDFSQKYKDKVSSLDQLLNSYGYAYSN